MTSVLHELSAGADHAFRDTPAGDARRVFRMATQAACWCVLRVDVQLRVHERDMTIEDPRRANYAGVPAAEARTGRT